MTAPPKGPAPGPAKAPPTGPARPIVPAAPAAPEATDEGPLPFTVRRAVPKIGRNEPCHCGSGKKYKRCCLEKDRVRLADPSPYAGLTMEEAKRDPARHGDASIFWEMNGPELAAVEVAKLDDKMLIPLFQAQLEVSELEELAATLDEAVRRGIASPDELRDMLVYEALRRGEHAFAREQQGKREGEVSLSSALNQLTLELLQRPPRKLMLVEGLARELADDRLGLVDLADSLLMAGLPGMGLLTTRAAAALPLGNGHDIEVLDDLFYDARKSLERKVDDPARWLLERTGAKLAPRRHRASDEEAAALRQKLAERETAIQQMRSERDRLAGELARSGLVPAGASAEAGEAAPSDEDARRLRRKIEELQAELRKGQEERLGLRRELRGRESAAGARPPGRPPARGGDGADEEADRDGEEAPSPSDLGGEPVARPIVFTDVFFETARDCEGRLGLKAQEAAVRFAALDPATWKQAKKMADLDGVFTLRVGIHHRLFVTREAGRLEARELVPREGFDRALKRYRR